MSNAGYNFDIRELAEDVRQIFSKYANSDSRSKAAGSPDKSKIRAAVLTALMSGPKNAPAITKSVLTSTAGIWAPKSSDLYPLLEQLEVDGFVTSQVVEERKEYSLTDAGNQEAEAAITNAAEQPDGPEENSARGQGHEHHSKAQCHCGTNLGGAEVLKSGAQLAQAVTAVAGSANKEQQARAVEILNETKRRMYELLAEN